MTYAYLTDGLDPDQKDQFDRALDASTDDKSKARRERQAVESLGAFVR